MKKHIPNFITLLNLACGTVALYLVLIDQVNGALLFLLLSFVMDFLDGTIARWLKVSSEIGKQLDSLADHVSFGLVPTAMIFMTLKLILFQGSEFDFSELSVVRKMMLGSVVIVPLFSALRLARFNLQEDVSDFIGLPTPAFAIFWTGIYYDFSNSSSIFGQEVTSWFFLAIVFLMTFFMVVPLPMLSLKFKNFKLKPNFSRYLLILFSLIIVVFTGIPGLTLVVLTYILLSLVRIVLT